MSSNSILLQHFPALETGVMESPLQGVRFFKSTQPIPRRPLVYDPGICIVVQGHKTGYLGGEAFRYDADNYLVTSVTMPFECETFRSPETPLLGLYIDIDLGQLNALISGMGLQAEIGKATERGLPRGIGPAALDAEMADAIARLIKALGSETEARLLGPGLVREVLFRALGGTQAPVLHALAMYSGTFSKVAQVLRIMQSHYAEKLDVEQLAERVHMSPSAFHRAFKEITSDTPIQYLKKVRLTKARELMLHERIKAYMAADRVGYESPSQFSREFKRYFGQSPAEMTREACAA
ncbi:AraC family transcriptional regulator [Marichromatium sp. AB31]|uniref:AraC family transcriptional regulator n=1 Tax=Marichromatium sp. AB31 TaxID=2483362 RepID=UPI000F40B062|nr:AraC family transcriptional regulator [Marichromatium sp. AB31]RNE89316.1 AraC family transcriptional regulator [Marichromatium sp. AB31]